MGANKIRSYINSGFPDAGKKLAVIFEDFQNINKVHDWRNYIDLEIQEAWPWLNHREKYILYLHAKAWADKEEWE